MNWNSDALHTNSILVAYKRYIKYHEICEAIFRTFNHRSTLDRRNAQTNCPKPKIIYCDSKPKQNGQGPRTTFCLIQMSAPFIFFFSEMSYSPQTCQLNDGPRLLVSFRSSITTTLIISGDTSGHGQRGKKSIWSLQVNFPLWIGYCWANNKKRLKLI